MKLLSCARIVLGWFLCVSGAFICLFFDISPANFQCFNLSDPSIDISLYARNIFWHFGRGVQLSISK